MDLLQRITDDTKTLFRNWHKPKQLSGLLETLHIYKKDIQVTQDHVKTCHKLGQRGLEQLELHNEEYAHILRQRFLNKEQVRSVALELHLSENEINKRQNAAFEQLAEILFALENELTHEQVERLLSRLKTSNSKNAVGLDAYVKQISDRILGDDQVWIYSLEGFGGIGKTTLAESISRSLLNQRKFDEFAWVSARQDFFESREKATVIRGDTLDDDELVSQLLQQFLPELKNSTFTLNDAMEHVRNYIKQHSTLIVVDNLEARADFENILPLMRQLATASKVILTSRENLGDEAGITSFEVNELQKQDVFELIRNESRRRNISQLANASDEELDTIYSTVGGNPLALKLVVGQVSVHPLPDVLTDLRSLRSKKIEDFYRFIYLRAWNALDKEVREVFVAMAHIKPSGGTLEMVRAYSQKEQRVIQNALFTLYSLYLVDSIGDLNSRIYSIHNLTRTFLLGPDVLNW